MYMFRYLGEKIRRRKSKVSFRKAMRALQLTYFYLRQSEKRIEKK